jgi:Sulfotransferase domain
LAPLLATDYAEVVEEPVGGFERGDVVAFRRDPRLLRMRLPVRTRRGIRRGVDLLGELTGRFRLLPSYVIVGAQKGGTSALYEYLVRHPLVGRSTNEEIQYFSLNYARGTAWYRGHFPTVARAAFVRRRYGRDLVTGESSPYYLFHPLALERIRELLPDARLIVVLRNPVDRAYSQYNHSRQMGAEPLETFEAGLAAEAGRLDGELEKMLADPFYNSFSHYNHSYLARGLYVEQLERLYRLFDERQILLEAAEDLSRHTEAVYLRVLEFLGLPARRLSQYPPQNVRRYPPMRPETRRRLVEYFAEPNERLYAFLGRDLGWDRP